MRVRFALAALFAGAAMTSAALTSAALATSPLPELAAAPQVQASDRWAETNTYERAPSTWRQTHDETTVVRVTDDGITLATHQVGATGTPAERMVGRDWSRFRSIGGKEVVVNRPLSFPLTLGKSWDVTYTDTAPGNRTHRSETITEHFRVTGEEDIDVTAGHFHAIKIEANGKWSAEVAIGPTAVAASHVDANGGTAISTTRAPVHGTAEGRLYKVFWYVPDVHRWVKSIEENYDTNGNRNERYTDELESWHPGT